MEPPPTADVTTPAKHSCRRRFLIAFIGLCAPFVFTAFSCERSAPENAAREVVLYYSADEPIAQPIIAAFEKETGIRVLSRGDTEATKNTGLVQKIRIERAHPRADVFWSSEVFQTIRLAQENILAPIESQESFTSRPAAFRGENNLWVGFAQRARVLVYNTKRVTPEEAPRNLTDLANPRWRGRIVIARPQFGTTRGHIAALVALWGEEAAHEWLSALKENNVRLLDGNASVVRAVAYGEADVGLTDTDDVWAGQRNDWPVDLVYIRHDHDELRAGALTIPNAVSRIAGGPHPEAAEKLIAFLTSARVERMLAQSDSRNIPVRDELNSEFPNLDVPDPIESLTFERIAEADEAAIALCTKVFSP